MSRSLQSARDITLKDLIEQLRAGERNYYQLLLTPENCFITAPFETLMQNTDDVLACVNRVQILEELTLGIFRTLLVKHHDNGSVKLIFCGSDPSTPVMRSFFDQLLELLGNGYNDIPNMDSFLDPQVLERAKQPGAGLLAPNDIVHLWLDGNLTYLLQYTVLPKSQFSFHITLSPPKMVDQSVRSKTLLHLLSTDIEGFLSTVPEVINKKKLQDGYMVELLYELPGQEIGFFDHVQIRYPIAEGNIGHDTQLIVTFLRKAAHHEQAARSMAERVIAIYGTDCSGSKDLEPYEWEYFEQNSFWTGRMWILDHHHALNDLTRVSEIMYILDISNVNSDQGLKLTVQNYGALTDYHSKNH